MFRKSVLWLSAALLAAGVGFFSTDTASAQWNRYGGQSYRYNNYGHNGYGNYGQNGYGHQNYGYQNYGYRNYSPSYRGTHNDWHDTSHYDYHQPSVRWHGNHIDVTPGHYDYHRQGHWDRH